jgi:hypothetical protein
MTATSFFKKIGRGLQKGVGNAVGEFGKVAGGLAAKAGADFLTAAPVLETAGEGALVALKTGGLIRAPKNKPVKILAHGQEYMLPVNAKPTKRQKAIVASNKRKQKKGVKFV